MKKTVVVAVLATALAFAIAVSCSSEDLCGESPLCDGNVATNCDPSCTVGPCSNSPTLRDCGDQAACQIATGDVNSTRFFRSRAVCVLDGSSGCNPDASGAPTCDGLGNIQGCSAYKQVIVAPCAQAGLFFDTSECCLHPPDGGVPDAGAPDAGDAGP